MARETLRRQNRPHLLFDKSESAAFNVNAANRKIDRIPVLSVYTGVLP